MTITSKQELTPEMIKAIEKRPIFWSNTRSYHWFFDFEFNGLWISSKHINNELTEIDVEVFDPKQEKQICQ